MIFLIEELITDDFLQGSYPLMTFLTVNFIIDDCWNKNSSSLTIFLKNAILMTFSIEKVIMDGFSYTMFIVDDIPKIVAFFVDDISYRKLTVDDFAQQKRSEADEFFFLKIYFTFIYNHMCIKVIKYFIEICSLFLLHPIFNLFFIRYMLIIGTLQRFLLILMEQHFYYPQKYLEYQIL